MLESIRVIMMERMHKMRRISDNWVDDICPSYRKKLELAKLQQRFWHVVPGGGSKFEVRKGHDAFIVDEAKRTCTCRMWELSGLPCEHSVASIFFLHKNPDDYVPAWFRKEMYVKAYSYHIEPVQGMNQWPANELNKPLPPKPRKMPGRPKKKRKRAGHELPSHTGKISKQGIAMTCQTCLQEGHNKRSCKREPVEKPPRPPSKKVGRPKKDKSVVEAVKGNLLQAVNFYILEFWQMCDLHIVNNAVVDGTSVQAGKGQVMAEGTSVQAEKGKGMAEGTSVQVGKGKGMAEGTLVQVGKGKGMAEGTSVQVRKGKGMAEGTSTEVPRPSVGGFMSDARRSYPIPFDDSQSKEKMAKLIPKRRKSARLAVKHACRPVQGPGSSKDDVMDVD